MFALIGKCELKNATPKNKLFNPYEYASIMIDDKEVGFVARVHLEVEKKYDLKSTYICELDFDSLRYGVIKAKEYSKFQASQKDLSFLAPKELNFEEIKQTLKGNLPAIVKDFYVIDIFKSEELGDKQSITIRFILQDNSKTLEDKDIKETIDSIISTLKDKLNLELR